jgi:hypothetical protein
MGAKLRPGRGQWPHVYHVSRDCPALRDKGGGDLETAEAALEEARARGLDECGVCGSGGPSGGGSPDPTTCGLCGDVVEETMARHLASEH